jgi:hypothetical protein
MTSGYVPPVQFTDESTPNFQKPKIAVSNNQITSSPSQDEIQNLQNALKSSSKFVSCPYCRYHAMTQVDKSCSIPNIICAVGFCVLPWLIFQPCRGKDLSCYDAEHFCTRCHNKLASYNAC